MKHVHIYIYSGEYPPKKDQDQPPSNHFFARVSHGDKVRLKRRSIEAKRLEKNPNMTIANARRTQRMSRGVFNSHWINQNRTTKSNVSCYKSMLKEQLGVCFALHSWKEYLLFSPYLITLGKDVTFPIITKFKTNRYLSYLAIC